MTKVFKSIPPYLKVYILILVHIKTSYNCQRSGMFFMEKPPILSLGGKFSYLSVVDAIEFFYWFRLLPQIEIYSIGPGLDGTSPLWLDADDDPFNLWNIGVVHNDMSKILVDLQDAGIFFIIV